MKLATGVPGLRVEIVLESQEVDNGPVGYRNSQWSNK